MCHLTPGRLHSHLSYLESALLCTRRYDAPHTHYDQDETATFMADKTTIRLLFALAAANGLHMEHLDITWAYLHEKYEHDKPVYIWQPPRFDGSYKHPVAAGRLFGIIYGTPPAAHTYSTKLHEHLKKHD